MTIGELKNPGLLKTQCYIDGDWSDADSHETFQITNPATGETIADVAKCGTVEARRAIASAHRAGKAWQKRTALDRSSRLRKWLQLVLENEADLGRILMSEQGKPLAEARGEIAYAASYIEWFAEEAKRIYGDTIPAPSKNQRILCIKQPVGVVACITPWNFPSAMLARKIAPALAAGCTVVCKPANATPLSALALAELAAQAGIPKGVINVLAGDTQAIGDELTTHPDVRKVTFTGSTEVGKLLLKKCASTIKRTSMELGGNAPFVVFGDADLNSALRGAMANKFRNAGQTCVCANRFLVQADVHDQFVDLLSGAIDRLKVGNGANPDTEIGPLISSSAADGIRQLVDDALANGAKKISGAAPEAWPDGPCYFPPTLLTGVTANMRVFREEIFGPVVSVTKFGDEAEAVALANDTNVGLAAYLYTRDIGRAWRVMERLECGVVGLNEGMTSNAMAPFGGVKESGHGREGSKYGLDDYLELKYVCIGGVE